MFLVYRPRAMGLEVTSIGAIASSCTLAREGVKASTRSHKPQPLGVSARDASGASLLQGPHTLDSTLVIAWDCKSIRSEPSVLSPNPYAPTPYPYPYLLTPDPSTSHPPQILAQRTTATSLYSQTTLDTRLPPGAVLGATSGSNPARAAFRWQPERGTEGRKYAVCFFVRSTIEAGCVQDFYVAPQHGHPSQFCVEVLNPNPLTHPSLKPFAGNPWPSAPIPKAWPHSRGGGGAVPGVCARGRDACVDRIGVPHEREPGVGGQRPHPGPASRRRSGCQPPPHPRLVAAVPKRTLTNVP